MFINSILSLSWERSIVKTRRKFIVEAGLQKLLRQTGDSGVTTSVSPASMIFHSSFRLFQLPQKELLCTNQVQKYRTFIMIIIPQRT